MTNEMTAEEAVKQIKENCYFASISEKTKQALDKAIKALEQLQDVHDTCKNCIEFSEFKQQPSEDCISRQAVLDVINFEDKWLFDANGHNANTHIAFNGLESRVKALPSVTPQRPKGKWKRIAGFEDCNYDKCSVCGVYQLFYYGKPSTNYCPNCGAEMGGADETN